MKIYSYIAFIIFVLLALIPPIDIQLKNPAYPYWLWMILTAGFFGLFTIFIKTNIFVKIVAIGGFINCFFGALPYVSFTSYVSLVLCCYFYICCSRIEDWKLIFRAIQTLVILNSLLIVLEFFHKDNLMDWGETYIQNFGVLGHHMQMGSFAVVVSALLLSFSKLNIIFPIAVAVFCKSSWTFIAAGSGIFVYLIHKNKDLAAMVIVIFAFIFSIWAIKDSKIYANMPGPESGRSSVWLKAVELTHNNHKDITGWGIGSFKEIFYQIANFKSHPIGYKTAHNFIVQLVFEVGYPATGCLLFGLGWLWWALWRARNYYLCSGLTMICMDGLVHFPERMMQSLPLIIVFLAYCTFSLRKDKLCPTLSSPN